jgi:hypothetical protein
VKLPPLFEIGVDPPQKILSVTAFFTKKPPRSLIATAPAPLRARAETNAIYGSTEEWPDAEIKRVYGKTKSDDDDDEASDADWARFFKATSTWLASTNALFALISADIEVTGYDQAIARGTAQMFDVIVPHLTTLLRSQAGDGILFGNLAFGVALRLQHDPLTATQREALIAMGEAAIEHSAHGDDTWRELFEELMPSPRKPR